VCVSVCVCVCVCVYVCVSWAEETSLCQRSSFILSCISVLYSPWTKIVLFVFLYFPSI